jgi:hypothetical protein
VVEDAVKTCAIGLLLTGLSFTACGTFPTAVWGQSDSAPPPALNANPIGKVNTATGTIRVAHAEGVVVQANLPPGGGIEQSKAGALLYRGDVIQTGPDGKLEITLVDGTSVNVSSNARIEMSEFVYDPNGHSNSTLLNLTRGTFTFIAGNVAHTGDMKIDTPLGTLGIRGTAPRIEIMEDGSVKFSTLVERK